MKNRVWILSVLVVVAGCATRVDMGELPQSHPAHPQAQATPVMERSALLKRHLAPPDTDPLDDAEQHDHLQQKQHGASQGETQGMQHGPHDADHQQHSHREAHEGQQGKVVYVCPKHASEQSSYTGNCMRCNRPLVRKTDTGQVPQTQEQEQRSNEEPPSPYLCTMHPALPLESPGLCPVCGMQLVNRTEMDP